MIQTLDLRGSHLTRAELLARVPRAQVDIGAAVSRVEPLIADVRERGSVALVDQAERFDGVRPSHVRIPPERIQDALTNLPPEVKRALLESINRVQQATAAQVPPERVTTLATGATVTQRWSPVSRVGLYVPGGKAVYPSSVVMNVVAAQVAGVEHIALASPAQREFSGEVHPTILAAAALLGITEVYAMGGAGAIAALAYGVADIELEPVDVITGPGNVFVAAAKRVVNGVVGIDAEAGTTEIVIIADATAVPDFVASDLISQAEHDEAAASVLITDSPDLAEAVRASLQRLVPVTGNRDRVVAALGGPQSAIILVDDSDMAVAVSNAYGPEHLELHTAHNATLVSQIRNAGAIFVGPYSPVSLGDYIAGSNHVLPTGGSARYTSGLGAYAFLRAQQIVEYSADALRDVQLPVVALAEAEQLPGHGDAVTIRFS
ncbi:histidinol dehydrogenase [Klugiella xanthotipulae]|uniref:Histidinol dehydrogenase n=1 Tax=Klugiella xanthotipulae TaxID=244735 RepID=A0A543HSW4_9MICO|nr:histidinol dehydrogenase [Klugiella xanthotipulae]TQM61422.1 histidinol dehydrogenase [Klugiella xanthotipulae]